MRAEFFLNVFSIFTTSPNLFRFGFKKQKVKTNKKALALYLPENLPDFQARTNHSKIRWQTFEAVAMKINDFTFKDIDKLLNETIENGFSNLERGRENTFRISKALRLIKNKTSLEYELDENGVLALEIGSTKEYFESIRKDRELETSIKNLTNHKLKYNTIYTLSFAVFGFALSFIPTLLSEDKMIKESQLLRKSIDELSLKYDNYQKQLHQKNILILELKNEINLLKEKKIEKK
ncbi:hypothetical protein FHR24_003108 [Wenyingzhuangia heitensis]|uniref:Uncharacterized protein n=1 Tax=Wenyingzhuangia heitensis TaxID=1487859 RepID=A0ABX0UCS9_9FLAO|nr:hypothetical protein [Wenyingzhuangia heitensis]NIJ46618.1 hypothetical protein [Wenyingzhuangia heitensis]